MTTDFCLTHRRRVKVCIALLLGLRLNKTVCSIFTQTIRKRCSEALTNRQRFLIDDKQITSRRVYVQLCISKEVHFCKTMWTSHQQDCPSYRGTNLSELHQDRVDHASRFSPIIICLLKSIKVASSGCGMFSSTAILWLVARDQWYTSGTVSNKLSYMLQSYGDQQQ